MAPAHSIQRPLTEAERLAVGLGWFSLGLGLAKALAPRKVAQIMGVGEESSHVLRMLGIRQLAHGAGILGSRPRPTTAIMSRVAGDMMDLAFLGSRMLAPGTDKARLCGAVSAIAGITAIDLYCSQQLAGSPRLMSRRRGSDGTLQVSKSITINRDPADVHAFWRDFSNLPRFMYHLKSVEILDDRRSRWVAKAPFGRQVEWEAEITEDSPGRISWQSLPRADVGNSGSVSFGRGPGGRGTVVRVELEYLPPGRVAGSLLARLAGEDPEQQIYDDLRRFKQMMEIGEVVLSDANLTTSPRVAQPPARVPAEVMA